jgi:VCBS repeat-containing protein
MQSNADQQQTVVWRLDAGDTLTPVPVTVGATDGNTSQVTSGELTSGQRVAIGVTSTSGASRLSGLRFGG